MKKLLFALIATVMFSLVGNASVPPKTINLIRTETVADGKVIPKKFIIYIGPFTFGWDIGRVFPITTLPTFPESLEVVAKDLDSTKITISASSGSVLKIESDIILTSIGCIDAGYSMKLLAGNYVAGRNGMDVNIVKVKL